VSTQKADKKPLVLVVQKMEARAGCSLGEDEEEVKVE